MEASPHPAAVDEHLRRRNRRLAGALLLALASGGVLLAASLRIVLVVARMASSRVGGATILLVPGHALDRDEVGGMYARRLQRSFALWRVDRSRVVLLSGGGRARA